MSFCPFRIQFFELRFFKYSWKAFNFVRDVLQVNRRYYHRFIQSAKEAIFIHCLRNKMCKSSELLVLTGIYILWLQDINKIKKTSQTPWLCMWNLKPYYTTTHLVWTIPFSFVGTNLLVLFAVGLDSLFVSVSDVACLWVIVLVVLSTPCRIWRIDWNFLKHVYFVVKYFHFSLFFSKIFSTKKMVLCI